MHGLAQRRPRVSLVELRPQQRDQRVAAVMANASILRRELEIRDQRHELRLHEHSIGILASHARQVDPTEQVEHDRGRPRAVGLRHGRFRNGEGTPKERNKIARVARGEQRRNCSILDWDAEITKQFHLTDVPSHGGVMRFQIACAAALLAVATACSDSPSAPSSGSQIVPADGSTTLAGTIFTAQTDSGRKILLVTAVGDSVVLLGPVALAASEIAGSPALWVTGVLSAPKVMYVAAYQVQTEAPSACSPAIIPQPGFTCQDGPATRRRR